MVQFETSSWNTRSKKLGGAGGIRTHEWRFCRAFVLRWPVSFEQVRNVLAGLLWDVLACLGANVQRIVQRGAANCTPTLDTLSVYHTLEMQPERLFDRRPEGGKENASATNHFLRHVHHELAVVLVGFAQKTAKLAQKARVFARTAPSGFVRRLLF